MKKVNRLAALMLALVLLMTPIVSVQAKETVGTAKDKTLYYFDLEEFLDEAKNDKVHYDYLKLASALQGLANREEPRLYFRYYDTAETDFAMERLTDEVELWWLEQITDESNGYGKLKDGGDLAEYEIVEVEDYWQLFSLFCDSYEGIVLWDEDAPATANVASTIAGVENLLPVRLSNGQYDVYIQMLKHGFSTKDVKRNLCGLFSGTGYIPTLGSSVPGAKMQYTTTPSTQSVKTDPYLWAKMFYLDTGLTNPTMMSFAIDGGSWEYRRTNQMLDPENKNRGELYSANIPEYMRPGERLAVSFTYENIGQTDWTWANYDRLTISTDGVPAAGDDFHFYVDAESDQGYTSNHDRLFLGQSGRIKPGQTAQFKGYLQAPKSEGIYKVQFMMSNDLAGPISLPLKHTIEVTNDLQSQTPAYHPLEKPVYTDAELDAEIIMAGIPTIVEPNESVTANVVVKNIGTNVWEAGEVALACGTQSVLLTEDTASGKTAMFTVSFTAPGTEGDFSVTLQMKNGTANLGDAYECKLTAKQPETIAEYDCEIVNVKYEKGLAVGGKIAAYVEVVNTGSKTWTAADGIKLAENSGERYMSTTSDDDDADVLISELAMEDGIEVKSGEHYFFHFDLHSYTNTGSGEYYLEPKTILNLELNLTSESGAFGDAAAINLITYEPCEWEIKTFAEANDVPMSGKDRDATILWAAVPKSIEAGTTEPFCVAIKNTGTIAWTRHVGLAEYNMVNLGIGGEMLLATDANGTNSDSGSKNRLRIPSGLTVQPGEVLVISGYLLAPEDTDSGTCDYEFQCVVDSATADIGGAVGDKRIFGIRVSDSAKSSFTQTEQNESQTEYIATLIEDNVPDQMEAGEALALDWTFRNDGTATWGGYNNQDAVPFNFVIELLDQANGTTRTDTFRFSRGKDGQGNWREVGNWFWPNVCGQTNGQKLNSDGWLLAPTTPGIYLLKIGISTNMKSDRQSYKFSYEKEIVVGESSVTMTTEEMDWSESAFTADLIADNIPDTMQVGENKMVRLSLRNIGTATWKSYDYGANCNNRLVLVDEPNDTDRTSGFRFSRRETFDNVAANCFYMGGLKECAPGYIWNYDLWLHAPTTDGYYTLKIGLDTCEADEWYTYYFEKTIKVGEPTDEPIFTAEDCDAEVIANTIPTAVGSGADLQNTVWMKNSGQRAWTPATDSEGYFLRYEIAGNTIGYAPVREMVAPDEKTEFTLCYDAADFDDDYSIQVQMVCLDNGNYCAFGDQTRLHIDAGEMLGVKGAEILSVTIPEELREGTKGEVIVEVLNIGSMTWDSNVALAEQGTNAFMSKTGAADDAQTLLKAVAIEPGVEVATGERYIFHFDLHTWTNAGTRMIYEAPGTNITQQLRMEALKGDDAGTFGDAFEIKSLVTQIPVESELTVYADPDDVAMSGEDRSYEIISASVPKSMNGSQIAPVTFTVKNTGNTAWVKHDGQYALHKMRLAMVSEGKEFGLYTDLNGVTYHSGDRNRIDLKPGETVQPGDVYTFEVFLKAPAYTGNYKIELYLTADGVGPEFSNQQRGEFKSYSIRVDGATLKGEDIYTNEGILYEDASNQPFQYSQLASADLFIGEKAFFFDLWIDDAAKPIDDRWQPLGTDERVLRQVMNSQRKRAQAYEEGTDPWNKITGERGTGTFVVDGFPPWWLKYSGISDPESSLEDWMSEQYWVDFIGEYGGWMDADAAGTISLANASVFRLLELQVGEYAKKITQAQPEFDKSVGDPSVVYDPNTTYIVFFMGDWDGSAWNGNRMHAIYNDPRRGEIPVVWPIVSGLSYRIPHVHNMMYDRATPNDFFAASDNGIGYMSWNYMADPRTEKSGITKADGLEIHNDFVDYSRELYDIYDLDVMTWYIVCGHPERLTAKTTEALAMLHPYGVITNELVDPYVHEDGTVTLFQPYNGWASNLGTEQMRIDAAARLAAYIKFDRQFLWLRSCKATVSRICQTLELMDEQNPGLNYKVVDQYTYFRLMKEADGGRASGAKYSYTAPKAKNVTIDGVVSKGEWDGAAEMVISPTSEEVSKHGFNWAPSNLKTEADLKSTYKIKWDEQNLYILEERIDDDVKFADPAVNSMQWLVDGSGIYMDTDDDDNNYYAGDFAVLFNRDQSGKVHVFIRSGQANGGVVQRRLESNEYQAVCKNGENGNYVYEIAINWSVVTSGFRPTANTEVGMTMLALDGDMAYSNTRQIMWHGNGDSQANWGILKFSN